MAMMHCIHGCHRILLVPDSENHCLDIQFEDETGLRVLSVFGAGETVPEVIWRQSDEAEATVTVEDDSDDEGESEK